MERIDLAHAAPVRLGQLRLDPPVRQIARDDGASELVEPRVMQVLLALARADGAIVTRDQLTLSCWEGRIVGEDAINRVMSRLRRVADGIGAGSFRLETITRVGYRLVAGDGAAGERAAAAASIPAPAWTPGRRGVIAGAALVVAGGAGAFALLDRDTDEAPPVPSDVAPLMAQAGVTLRDGSGERRAQAIGFYRRVVELRPDYADGWGSLAVAYAIAARAGSSRMTDAMEARMRAAAQRARALDPNNAPADLASLVVLPRIGNWHRIETGLRTLLRRRPDYEQGVTALGTLMMHVGRCRDASALFDRAIALQQPTPYLRQWQVVSLWAANRLEEADRAAAEASTLYPRHFAVWFTRFYLLLYTGRAEQAIAMAEDVDARPGGIPAGNIERVLIVARAVRSQAPSDIDRALAPNVALAEEGTGYAENALQFAAALGRLETAFRIADAYFLGRGSTIADVRFDSQDNFTAINDRRTHILFLPSTAPMRADPRFASLVEEVGLTRYWRESGSEPDHARRV